jgi:hypothetical protein
MGNEQSSRSVTVHPLSRLCKELQGKLIQSREDGDNSEHRHESLPRATKVNGRFVLTPESFPDYIDYGSLSDLYKWKTECEPHETYTDEYLSEQLPVIKPNQELLARGESLVDFYFLMNIGALSGTIQTTWLGHASVLTQWDGWNVLADPIFSERCSPVQWAGPKRLRPSPVQAIDLPPVDVCVISHNHYDHLDVNTVKEMNISHPNLIWMVPLGMKEWMADEGVHNVVELDWSEKVMISDLSGKNRPPLTIHCWCFSSCLFPDLPDPPQVSHVSTGAHEHEVIRICVYGPHGLPQPHLLDSSSVETQATVRCLLALAKPSRTSPSLHSRLVPTAHQKRDGSIGSIT